MPWHRDFGELVEISRIGAEELSVEWQIQNVLSLTERSGDVSYSPEFRIGDVRLYLTVTCKRERQSPASEMIELSLNRFDGGTPKTFHISVGIRGSEGVEERGGGKKKIRCFCFWKDFCSRKELTERKTRLMPDGVFRITCVLKRVIPRTARGVSSSASIQNDSEIREQVAPDNGRKSLDKQEHQSSDDCVICYERPINSVLYRCGHMCMCYNCAFKLWKSNSSALCPVCRNSIQDVIKVFK